MMSTTPRLSPTPNPAATQRRADVSFEAFCSAWRDEMLNRLYPESDSLAVRHEFCAKLLSDFLETDLEGEFYCVDEEPHLGLDAFYLDIAQHDPDEDEIKQDPVLTAHLMRFLAPSDFPEQGRATLRETNKLLHTLQGAETPNSIAPLLDFVRAGGNRKRITLVFASAEPLPPSEAQALENAEAILSAAFPFSVEVKAISLQTIYERDHVDYTVHVPLQIGAPCVVKGAPLLIGAVTLPDLFAFLNNYKQRRGDIDPLYEKNVRVFLGRTGKINKGISATLRQEPENFGLYNNGITIVAREIAPDGEGGALLTDPAIVNGCQTTRTVFDTLSEMFRAGAQNAREWQTWRDRLNRGAVIVKVVRVAPITMESPTDEEGDQLLAKITRYTNSQNSVQDKDFVALDQDFRRWKRDMAMRGVFLEILRNEGTAQLARQKKQVYNGPRYESVAKAFEILKVYGAGWMNAPGPAWNKNAAFTPPKGAIFKAIVRSETFGADDLLAALHLQQLAHTLRFGRKAGQFEGRRLTRFLFYRVAIELLRRQLRRLALPFERPDCTRAVLALSQTEHALHMLGDEAAKIVDDYMALDSPYSIHKEPHFSGNFNDFLKKEDLAKDQSDYPQLFLALSVADGVLSRDPLWKKRVEAALCAARTPSCRQSDANPPANTA